MSTRSCFCVAAALALLFACADSRNCPYSTDRIDPPVSDLSVTWKDGSIGASLMPIVLPDPIRCEVRLILENRNKLEAFSKVEIPSADVILVENDSTLGTIPISTDWDGLLAPGKRDTIRFYKLGGPVEIFNPPCYKRVLVDFKIRNSDGDAVIFRPDTLTFWCVY